MEVAERMARIINFTVCGVDEADAVWGEALYGDEPIGWRIKRDVLDAYFERKWKLSKDDRLAIAKRQRSRNHQAHRKQVRMESSPQRRVLARP